MILHALNQYYLRKQNDPTQALAPEGFESKAIPFVLVIDEQGRLLHIEDTRSGEGKKRLARNLLVPQGVKKTSGVAANLLWDSAEYVLGIDTRAKPERVQQQHQAFRARVAELAALNDAGVNAVLAFLADLPLADLQASPYWAEWLEHNPNLTFQLAGDDAPVCQRAAVIDHLLQPAASDGAGAICLVTGEPDVPARLHPSIKGVWGAQTAGANIVSFNLPAFNSFGREQGANAPVGTRAVFGYTTALNHLLARDSRQRLQVGDASTVFWAAEPHPFEQQFPALFGDVSDDPDRGTEAVRSLYRSVQHGVWVGDAAAGQTRFHVLGLAPNAARIAVRFWQVGTVAELAPRIARHFQDLDIVRPSYAAPHDSLYQLLLSIAVLHKAENIPPNLAGDTLRAILAGTPYPATLLQAAVRRCRAERQVSPQRAALIKASLNRLGRIQPQPQEEITVSLDPANTNIGYRLGRLFALLEKIQEEAATGGSSPTTIRDRYYGAASGNPVSVFPTLLKLNKHHLAKLVKGRAINLEKIISEVIDGFNDFPAHLDLADQGRFAIGYYHQRQQLFTKQPETNHEPE